jgi:membrane protease YdiL (CAAX protease family)
VLEGLAASVVLGPALLVGLHFVGGFEVLRDVHLARAGEAPSLARVALLAGGAAYEEIVFRMGVQGLAFLALHAITRSWLPHEPLARVLAEAGAVLASALVFAAAHLAVFTQLLGPGGEPWHAGVFPWRVLAGILLAALFRWRGPGVAAWAHAAFNAALAIGAGPGVFL